ncbi:MAG: DUF502 domain-containing protein [Candidatus Nanohaloarchaeota archaeon QJJ-5]|nr:DUF502 domain-containing protein [Candidatus Nanohaloarchaeota archaeon QJJ-5]
MTDGLWPTLKRSFVAGLIALVPLVVIVWVLQWVYEQVRALAALQTGILQFLPGHPVVIAVSTVGGTVGLIIIVGLLSQSYLGQQIEQRIDDLVTTIPLVGVIYDAVKQTSEEMVDNERFSEPVKVETGPMRRTAFKTGNQTPDGREILFMPRAPNVMSGQVIEVDPDEIIETDEQPQDALERLISVGLGESEQEEKK